MEEKQLFLVKRLVGSRWIGMNRQKRKWFLASLALISVLLIGGTFAYFIQSEGIENKLKTADAKVYLNEKFNPNDNWVPGEEKQKEVRFGNEGWISSVLRVKFIPIIEKTDGTQEPIRAELLQLNFAENLSASWEQHGDWYYYKRVLKPSEMTEITLKSVTLSDQIGNDEHGILDNYFGVIFDVEIKSELLQASLAKDGAVQQKWEWVPEVVDQEVQWIQN